MPHPMSRERRLTAQPDLVRLEPRAEGESPRIVGYGAVFYNGTPESEYRLFDDLIERVMPGAFARAIGANADIFGLFNHDASEVLGRTRNRTLKLSIDSRGLAYDITPPDTSKARDVVELLRRGDVTGSSFSFQATKVAYVRGKDGQPDIRELHEVELFDVGPVTFPAYAGTEAGLRAADPGALTEVRSEVEAWRRGGDGALEREVQERARRLRLMEMAHE